MERSETELLSRIKNARSLVGDKRLANEAAVSSGVVLPILDALGWPVFDPNIVAPEYSVKGRRVDFALLSHGTPAVFVEVKQPGHINGADKQLFEYAFHEGVPIAVLTDGETWHFYLPAMQGSYDDRRVYLLDIVERDVAESAERLKRYLDSESVTNGSAFDRARNDYSRARQRKETAAEIPRVWSQLARQADSVLVELISSEVESRTGYKPAREDVLMFLERLTTVGNGTEPSPPGVKKPRGSKNGTTNVDEKGFWLRDQFYPCRNGRDIMLQFFRLLDNQDNAFLDRFIELPRHGRKRRYLAKSKEELYPGRPDIIAGNVSIIRPGYFLGTHYSHRSMRVIMRLACEVAGFIYDKDFRVNFG